MLLQVPVSSSEGSYFFAALWWPVDILEDLKREVDPLRAGQNADMMMMVTIITIHEYDDDGSACSLFHSILIVTLMK